MELKFVQSMRRQYEFSVDSFQIELDTYLEFKNAASLDGSSSVKMNPNFHPTVVAESVYGDIEAALRHLRFKRICTHKPEEIRGGGLLRYCNLLVRDFVPGDCDGQGRELNSTDASSIERLEQHMCSRFFIDFNDISHQQKKLISYIDNHFPGEDDLKFQYLLRLRRVVDRRTVCLMAHERTLILDLITYLVRQTLANNVAKTSNVPLPSGPPRDYYGATSYSNWDRNSYGPPPFLAISAPCPMSDRSSPLSAYSTLSRASSSCHISSPVTPEPHSRPSTPRSGRSPVAIDCSNQQGRQQSCCCCCGGCCCVQKPVTQSPSPCVSRKPIYHSFENNKEVYPAPPLPPIYYTTDQVTCFYQPANFLSPQTN